MLRAEFKLPSVLSEDAVDRKTPIYVKFEIPYFTVSGIQVCFNFAFFFELALNKLYLYRCYFMFI